MNTEIRVLTPDLADDFLDFFDRDAFSDHPEWSWCYCLYYHFNDSDAPEREKLDKARIRVQAAEYISDGRMRGYLLYVDGKPAGWCNAGERTGYRRLRSIPELWDKEEEDRILSVVCFVIAPAFRRLGLAARLLDRVCADAAGAGFSGVEAYPADEGLDCFGQYHGHLAMYLKNGFQKNKECNGFTIVRKEV